MHRPLARPFVLVTVLALSALGCTTDKGDLAEPAPQVALNPEFVGREACAECHRHEERLWHRSHHDLAIQEANGDTVLADFDDSSFTYAGVTSTFSRKDGEFIVHTDNSRGELEEFRVAYTFGAVPLQQYLIEFPGGRLQALGICWDTRPAEEGGQRWFHLYPDEEITHDDPLHWTGIYQNWNYMCAECHSTDLRKNYLPDEDRYETSWQEIDVSCEACHGPGSLHVEWGKLAAIGRADEDTEHMGLVVRLTDPGRGTWTISPETGNGLRLAPPVATQELEVCSRCHSRRALTSDQYVFGAPQLDTHRLALLEEGLYHADGQILEEVYVHGSFLQSKMHMKGVTCSDCHDPHSAQLHFPGDDVCARCHAATAYDTKEHHFHKPDTPGAHCVDCHMPPKNYMVVDPRHDHSLRIPRPDLSIELGTPNACNDCHREKSNRWSAEKVAQWYGPDRRQEPHFGSVFSAARQRKIGVDRDLVALIADRESAAIVRATALSLASSYPGPLTRSAIETALVDPDPLVRWAAVQALETSDPRTLAPVLDPMLSDPVRLVRMEAARLLAPLPESAVPASLRPRIDAAMVDYEAAQVLNSDQPGGQLNLGWVHSVRGRFSEEEAAYRRAIQIDPTFVPAYVNLADLYRRQNRNHEGEQALRDGLDRNPESGELVHSLGLALVRRGRPEDALEAFKKAVELQPESARYAYVLAIALHGAGHSPQALGVLETAHDLHPTNRDIIIALVTINRDLGDSQATLNWAKRLLELSPQDPEVLRMVQELGG